MSCTAAKLFDYLVGPRDAATSLDELEVELWKLQRVIEARQ
jgi:hypothetical protein